jgi:hypothetical protein
MTPTFASSLLLNPETTNPWSELVTGSELFIFSQKGAKGHVGGDGFVGYRHEFDNNLVVGVQASAGYAPRPARVRRLPDAETKLVRRQGTAGPHLEDGQSIFAEITCRGRACGPLSSQAARRRAAILGDEAHADQAMRENPSWRVIGYSKPIC